MSLRIEAVLLLAVLAPPLYAQQTENTPSNGAAAVPSQAQQPGERETPPEPEPQVLRASRLLDKEVRVASGEPLGKLEELVLGGDDGRVQWVVVSYGGFLGLGDRLTALPWHRISLSADEAYVVTDLTRDELVRAPSFARGEWPDFAKAPWVTALRKYYQLEGRALANQGMGRPVPDFAQLDRDADGKLNREEAVRWERLSSRFGQVDRDGDQQIDRSEFSAFERLLSDPEK